MTGDDIPTKATEFMKKVLTIGVGTLFLTEESLRSLISEFKLPKELLATILESANKTRRDFMTGFSQELVGKVMEKVDVAAVIEEVLRQNRMNLKIQIEFVPKDKK